MMITPHVSQDSRLERRSGWLLAVMLYIFVALFITWPLVTRLSTHLYGDFLTDAFQSVRHTWWIQHALRHGEPLFTQPTFAYPDGLYGAWLWANPLEFFPGWLLAFVMPVAAAANLTLLVHLVANGVAVYALVRAMTGRFSAALLAGLVFMSFPALQSRIYGGHVGVLALWPVPLYLCALVRLRTAEGRLWPWIVLGTLGFGLGTAGNSTLLVYYLLPVSGLALLTVLFSRDWRWIRRTLLVTALGGVLLLVFLVPLALETRSVPQYNPDIGGSVTYSADLLSFAAPSFWHPLFKHLDYPGRVLGTNLLEGTGYLGIITAGLALIAVWKVRAARAWLGLALIAWVLSLGPLLKHFDHPVRLTIDAFETYIPLPWAFLQKLPILEISRTPGRFNLTVALAMAVMVGYGAVVFWNWLPRGQVTRRVFWGVLMALIVLELRMFWPLPTEDARIPDAVAQLADRDDIRAVFNIPWDDRILAKHGLYLQTAHQKNMLAGQFIRDTPVNAARLTVLQDSLDPALLDAAGVDVVIYHKGGPVGGYLDEIARRQLGVPFFEDETLALFAVPPSHSLPGFTTVTPHDTAITNKASAYFYVPERGWATFTGHLTTVGLSDAGRVVNVLLDEQPVHRLYVDGELDFQVPVYVDAAGFYTVRLALDPPCPQNDFPALVCRSVAARDLRLENYSPDVGEFIEFDDGIVLEAALAGQTIVPGDVLKLRLSWAFEQPPAENLSRFVHLLGPDDASVTQVDGPIVTAFDHWSETLILPLPATLPPGTYNMVVGWYRYPSLERLEIDSAVAENRTLPLATFEVVP